MSDIQIKIELLKEHIREYPGFPKTGILFKDIFSVFQSPEITRILRDLLVVFSTKVKPTVECITALDARGFLLGPLIALELNVPFVPIRKKGKLPGKILSASYTLEYGEDTLEIQEGSIKNGQSVLIVDDLLATGGSLGAACRLVQQAQGKVAACLVVMELTELNGRSKIPVEVVSIIQF